ncbi:MAG: TlpA disulfide reductase family protein [Kiritimatiellia bacterium]|nr:TlpA disulfide reductase family protein [Kiritimatiellia bacterium]
MKNSIRLTLPALILASVWNADVALAQRKDKDPLPDVSIDQITFGESLNNIPFDAKAIPGKPLIVEFWGVRCGPCVAFLPELARLHKKNRDKGLLVVGIHCQQADDQEVLKLLKEAKVAYPVLRSGNVPVPFSGIPHAFIFGRDGKLTWQGNPHDDEFEKAIRAVLRP